MKNMQQSEPPKVNNFTIKKAKSETDLAYLKTRQIVLEAIKNCQNPEEKQRWIDELNKNIDPLTEEEMNFIKNQ